MLTERLFIFIGGLSSKAFAMLVTGFSAFSGVVIGEAITSQIGLSALAGGLATVFAAVFLVIPRVMEQRRKSRESNAKLQSDSIALLMTTQDRESAFYKAKIAALELIVNIHVKAKHDAIGEWSSMKDGYLILCGQIRALGKEPEIELHPKSYREVIGDSDIEIKAIAASRVAEAPPSLPDKIET
ncbi:MAG: hypothetical protein QOE26_2770 [Verrucomicrobiota bacterium]|jgi:hypothetical protein